MSRVCVVAAAVPETVISGPAGDQIISATTIEHIVKGPSPEGVPVFRPFDLFYVPESVCVSTYMDDSSVRRNRIHPHPDRTGASHVIQDVKIPAAIERIIAGAAL